MGLFGALFAGVSGLNSQSNKIGIISNNISNVNTVGFKQGQAAFNTLVVPSGSSTFSPGGVIGTAQQLINQQGLIQATSSSTDIAITGNGFYAVNTQPDGSGSLLLTRAGSFTQDSLGNFVNANGYFLQGIPITNPPTALNQGNLKTVNVNASASGTATPTTQITVAANFNAAQSVLLGSGEIVTLGNNNDTANVANTGAQIILPTLGNGLTRGDSISILSGGQTAAAVLTYGGFTQSRDVTAAYDTAAASAAAPSGSTAEGDGGTLLHSLSAGAGTVANAASTNEITVTVSNADAAYFAANGHITLSGASAINGIPLTEINGEHTITSITNGSSGFKIIHFTVTTTGGPGGSNAAPVTVKNRSAAFTGNVLNATNATSDLLAGVSATSFTNSALQLHIAVAGNTYTFTYNTQSDPSTGKFSSMSALADAINQSSAGQLTARINNGGQLYIGATDTTQGVTYSNGDDGSVSQQGIDWVQELGLPATQLANINMAPATNVHYFNSLNSLGAQVNAADPAHLVASVNNPTATATVSINEADPQKQITFTDGDTNVPTSITGSSLLAAFGFTSQGGGALTTVATGQTTGALDVKYNPGDPAKNMSSGAITPQFTKDITIFDALGNSHTLALNVVKVGTNTWAVELTAVPANQISTNNGDGQIANGIVSFKTDGTFLSAPQLGGKITIDWKQTGPNAVGAAPTSFNIDLSGLTQSASAFNVSVANQNGSSVGELTGVSIDASGFVVESFSNGQTQQIFQIPLANVNNPNGLESISGDAFQGTLASGQINLNQAGTNGVGNIAPSALEQSNVDISTQLTNLIVAQQAYGANSKVLTIADQLLQQLDQIIQ